MPIMANLEQLVMKEVDTAGTAIGRNSLAASVAAGLAAIPLGEGTPSHGAFKASFALLYSAAMVMLLVVNKIQLSQLAEEQRNAARLLRQKSSTVRKAGTGEGNGYWSKDLEDVMTGVLGTLKKVDTDEYLKQRENGSKTAQLGLSFSVVFLYWFYSVS